MEGQTYFERNRASFLFLFLIFPFFRPNRRKKSQCSAMRSSGSRCRRVCKIVRSEVNPVGIRWPRPTAAEVIKKRRREIGLRDVLSTKQPKTKQKENGIYIRIFAAAVCNRCFDGSRRMIRTKRQILSLLIVAVLPVIDRTGTHHKTDILLLAKDSGRQQNPCWSYLHGAGTSYSGILKRRTKGIHPSSAREGGTHQPSWSDKTTVGARVRGSLSPPSPAYRNGQYFTCITKSHTKQPKERGVYFTSMHIQMFAHPHNNFRSDRSTELGPD